MKTAREILQKFQSPLHPKGILTRTIAIMLSAFVLISICPLSILAAEEYATSYSSDSEDGLSYDEADLNEFYSTDSVREIVSRREENVKHFLLPDGSIEAIVYSNAVHRKDENNIWQDIDNRLIENTNTNKQGYITSDGRAVFAKKISTDSSTIFEINENGYNIKVSFDNQYIKNTNAKLSNHAEKYIPSSENTFDEQYKKLKEIDNTTTLLYKNVLKGIDFEYKLFANDVKENIIVNKTSNEYVYSFVYELSGLCATLNSDGSISLIDADTREIKYEISAPFMYDANGEISYSVRYSLEEVNNGKYIITLVADDEWINDDGRALPVVIDPTVKSYTSMWDTYIDSNNKNRNYGTSSIVKVGSSCTALFKNAMPSLPSGSVILDATWYGAYYHASGMNFKTSMEVRMMEGSWSEYTETYTYLQNIYGADLGISSTVISTVTLNANPNYSATNPRWLSVDLTSTVQSWYNGTTNNGIAICHKSTFVFEQEGKNYCTMFISKDAQTTYSSYYAIHYSEPRIEDGIYRIETVDHLFLTVAGDGLQSGSGLVLAEDSATTGGVPSYNQLFKITYAGTYASDDSNYYIIRPMTNNCLSLYASCDMASNPTVNTSNFTTEAPDEQSWIISADGVYYTIRNRNNQNSQGTDYMLSIPIGALSGDTLTTTAYSFGNTIPSRCRWDLRKCDIYVDKSGLVEVPSFVKYDEAYDFEGYMRSSRPGVNGPVEYIVVSEDYSHTDKAAINHNTGVFTPLKPGSVLIGTSYNGAQTCYYTRVTIESTPFDYLITNDLLEYSDISRTTDGFYMLTKPLSSILNEAGIYGLHDRSKDENFTWNVLDYYDDWYIFAVDYEGDLAYGLLKMGEEESPGDAGVAISFVGFDYELLLSFIDSNNDYNYSCDLTDNLDIVTDPGNAPYDETVATYFSRTEAKASYLIAEEYINFIVENCCLNNQIMAPQAFNDGMMKCANNPLSQYKRLEEAMNQNNENASKDIIKNNNGIYRIEIVNPSLLTIYEKYAILMTHTGNVTFNSFAAEVEYHADMLLGFWDDLDISGYIYGCAIRADMGIDEEYESGVMDQYYDLDSDIVEAHKLEHGEY